MDDCNGISRHRGVRRLDHGLLHIKTTRAVSMSLAVIALALFFPAETSIGFGIPGFAANIAGAIALALPYILQRRQMAAQPSAKVT